MYDRVKYDIIRNEIFELEPSAVHHELVVFYNGLKEQEDECLLRLSDAFEKEHRTDADIEVRVKMLNINHGRNKDLMRKCKPLEEYAWFISISA